MTSPKLALLAALACTTTTTTVEGYGTVALRQVSIAEHDRIRASIKAEAADASSSFGLQLLVASVVDAEGNAVFTEADLPQLRDAAGSKVNRLIEAVLVANGIVVAKGDAGNAPA